VGTALKLEYNFGAATFDLGDGYEVDRRHVQPRRHRRRLRRGVPRTRANYGPGMIPFPSESADGIPSLDQVTESCGWREQR